jgi:hypothetical protein
MRLAGRREVRKWILATGVADNSPMLHP